MQINKRYEILEHLPTTGPMYIPITGNDELFVSEGFVVRFYKSDGSDWVANFKPGWTDCSYVKYYPNSNKVIVIADGLGYIMNPDELKPIYTFGDSIKNVFELEKGSLLIYDDIGVEIINDNGLEWESPRISWDGIKDIKIIGNMLTGLSYDPMDDMDLWSKFKINLITKEIEGGSYRKYYTDDNKPIKQKPWWKLWN